MPIPIKYTTTNISNALRKGNIALGVNADNYGPSSTTSWAGGVNIPSGGYVIHYLSGTNLRIRTATDDTLTTVAGQIMGTTYSTTAEALSALASSGITVLNSVLPPNTVTSGSKFYADVNLAMSYPKGGTIWYDLGGSGLNLSNTNFISSPPGVGSGQYTYTGTTDILNTDYHSMFFTIEFKGNGTYPNGWTGGWEKIFTYAPAGTDRSPGIWRYPDQRYLHWRYDPGNSGCDFGMWDGGQFPLNKTFHVGVTKNGNYCQMYVNGQPAGLAPYGGYYVSNPKTSGNASVGLFEYYTSDLCRIRSLQIFNRVLSDAEVKQTFYGGQIVTSSLKIAADSSNLSSHWTNFTDTTWSNIAPNTLDDFSSYNLGNPSWANNYTDITICVLAEKTSASNNSYACHPINKWNTGYNVNASFVLYFFDNYYGNNADGFFGWYGYTTNNGWCDLTGGNSAYRMNVGEIAHIVFQRNSSGGQMWVNGVKMGGRAGGTGTLGPNSAGYSDIGIYGPQPAAWAKVHQALFYNRELTDAEIVQNFNAVQHRIKSN
jgi:hypothetical protein